jgi:rare lipoprotein A
MKLYSLLFILGFLNLAPICQAQTVHNEYGKASFYSCYFEGKRTASGEIFRQNQYTAAHKSLPFGTWVKVINTQNKQSVIVCINDRGPFIKGRIIDLSTSAAEKIGCLNKGVFDVEIYVYHKDMSYIQAEKKSATQW